MSRIGRLAIKIPAGTTVSVQGSVVTVKGPLGELKQNFIAPISVKVDGDQVHVTRGAETKEAKSLHGLYRALIQNMVNGVTKGYEKGLVVNGVGYKVAMSGKKLVLNLGFSHPIEMETPAGITITCPSATEITVKGIDKAAVGQCAANIKALKKPEPYHGYGIRYNDEVIERKEGKTAGK